MDEMKIGSKFMKTLVAKLVKRTVKKKTGYDVDIQLNEFTAAVTDGTARVHLSVDWFIVAKGSWRHGLLAFTYAKFASYIMERQ